MDQQAEKDKTKKITGLGRRTREEIAKWNQMTATLVEKAHKARTRWYRGSFRRFINTRF